MENLKEIRVVELNSQELVETQGGSVLAFLTVMLVGILIGYAVAERGY
jgi:hypothetical protein